LFVSIATIIVAKQLGTYGGQIRHTEIRDQGANSRGEMSRDSLQNQNEETEKDD